MDVISQGSFWFSIHSERIPLKSQKLHALTNYLEESSRETANVEFYIFRYSSWGRNYEQCAKIQNTCRKTKTCFFGAKYANYSL